MGDAPVRTCLTCRQAAGKPALVRLAVADGAVVVDPRARLPGRGAYLCHRRACLDAGLRHGGAPLARALRQPRGEITVDEEEVRAAWRAAVEGARAAEPLPL
jgi:uncharacterized protein